MAAELQSADELVLSELVFDGTFSEANAEQVVALLASVVWREHGCEDNARTKLREDLKPVLKALHTAAHRVAKVRLPDREGRCYHARLHLEDVRCFACFICSGQMSVALRACIPSLRLLMGLHAIPFSAWGMGQACKASCCTSFALSHIVQFLGAGT